MIPTPPSPQHTISQLPYADKSRHVLIKDLETAAVFLRLTGLAESPGSVEDFGERFEINCVKMESGGTPSRLVPKGRTGRWWVTYNLRQRFVPGRGFLQGSGFGRRLVGDLQGTGGRRDHCRACRTTQRLPCNSWMPVRVSISHCSNCGKKASEECLAPVPRQKVSLLSA